MENHERRGDVVEKFCQEFGATNLQEAISRDPLTALQFLVRGEEFHQDVPDFKELREKAEAHVLRALETNFKIANAVLNLNHEETKFFHFIEEALFLAEETFELVTRLLVMASHSPKDFISYITKDQRLARIFLENEDAVLFKERNGWYHQKAREAATASLPN